jgi:endonuclease YncB( thermonuclease family)
MAADDELKARLRAFPPNGTGSLEQVRRGLAWHYKAYQREQPPEDRVSYAAAEEEARRLRLGLWQDTQPVPPWELRRDGHQNPQAKN